MARLTRNRSKLLLGCGSAALAMGLAAAPQSASAQAIQATHADVVGSITRTDTGTGTETITVNSEVTVVDWTPDEVSGTALDFLPTGNTVTFQNSVNITDFALLSRILPSTNNDIVVFDGTVISQLIDPATGGVLGTGGTLAFYSPTGIFVGPSGTFDVGNLILTTLDPDLASFDDFVQNGGQLQLTGAPGTTAPIIITAPLDAGIVASPENSYFAVVAAEIQMFGTSDVNGSTAFIAGEQVNLTVTNGLFDIQIPVGTSVTTPIVIDGDVGGPSSTGVTDDNHLIYAVAAAQNDPISLLFSGNLGFEPAGQAGIVNGEIILSANYEVNNRSVAGVEPSDGLFTRFNGKDELTTVAGSIFLEDFQSTSTILAAANEEVQVTAFNGPSSIDGNLLMFGRNFSELTASNGQTFSISGNALVSAADIGLIGSDLSPGDADAVAGLAFVDAFDGGNLTIGGDVRVNATAEAGEDLDLLATGSATGGQASIASNGGVLTILGDATASADAIPVQDSSNELNIGGTFTGGTAQLFVTQAGQISIGGFTNVTADAVGLFASTTNASTGSTALGGNAFVQVLDASGQIALDQSLFVSATAFAGGSNETNQGGLATGGTAQIFIDNDGVLSIANDLDMVADATGGFNVGGQGGDGNGGIARAVTSAAGGTISVGGDFNAFASGSGGDGIGGGNGFGGLAGAIAELGSVNISGNGRADALGFGGSATEGFGGDGGVGTGGLSFFQATGDLNDTATLTIGGTASLESTGRGGEGGDGDGSVIAPGRGGDGIGGQFATLNQADPNFQNGAFLLAGGDNGNLSVGGNSDLFNFGIGGDGGDGGTGQQGGDGGDGFGGTAQAGSSLLGNDGSVGAGTVNLGDVTIFGNGDGGNGGNGGGTGALQGNGGNGEGFGAFFSFRAGTIDAGNIDLNADGTGGSGDIGGAGTGGLASAEGDFGSNVTVTGLRVFTNGRGGFGNNQGGDAIGGTSQLGGGLFDMQVNGNLFIEAGAQGGTVVSGAGGNATGGTAQVFLGSDESSLTVDGSATLQTTATAASGNTSSQGALATGGLSEITIASLSTVAVGGDVFINARAFAGNNSGTGQGGDAIAGRAAVDVGNGGDVTVGNNLFANAEADAGTGADGGNAFGGFAQLFVSTGTIDIVGSADIDADGRGGAASSPAAFGGQGGEGIGGRAEINALGSLTEVATINIGGTASSTAGGFGGIGGSGDGGTIAAGRGGDGTGGNGEVILPIDGTTTGGAFIVAGGDNGNLNVGGDAFANAIATGGTGGNGGGSGQAGGDGGDAFGGTASIGLLLIGANDGSVGLGTADFGSITVRADTFGGAGGAGGSTGDPAGDGGNATGRSASVAARAGVLTAGAVSIFSDGSGGAGANGGTGTGGFSGSFMNIGGEATFDSYFARSSGFGGSGSIGVGGVGQGGSAFIGFQDGTGVIIGDALVDASGTGGSSAGGDGADGFGGIADIAIFNPIAGTGTIGGNAQVQANGFGGDAASGFVGGTGTGGEAFVQAQAGGSITFNALQVSAGGLGGAGSGAVGGSGFGGLAEILSFDAGSEIVVLNETQTSVNSVTQGNSVLAANGVGGATSGGTGLGGTGTGGEAVLSASAGGSITLAPDAGFGNRMTARGAGGQSLVDGGKGGSAVGGIGLIEVDGGTVDAGRLLFSVFAPGGFAFDDTINVDGGDGTGGERHVTVVNGGELTVELFGGIAGGNGGQGSGTGDGGSGSGGIATLFVENGTVNFVGRSIIANQVSGGGGFNGGNATAGSVDVSITGSTINIVPNANGDALFLIGSNAFGGPASGGDTAIGGSGIGGATNVSITESTISGGTFVVAATANGGSGFDSLPGQGGDATAGSLNITITDSILDLVTGEDTTGFIFGSDGQQIETTFPGEINRFEATAFGGSGLIGGSAEGGDVNVNLVNSLLSIAPSSTQDGNFAVSASATAGNGQSEMGDARGGSASFYSDDGVIDLDEMIVAADATATADPVNPTGVPAVGGRAVAGFAEVIFDTDSVANLAQLVISAQAQTSSGNSAFGGAAELLISDPDQLSPDVEIVNLDLNVNASGGDDDGPANFPGRFSIEASAGQLLVQNLTGTAVGDVLPGESGPSSLIADGGDILVSGTLFIDVLDNFVIRTGSGSIIGGPSILDPSAMIDITSQGTVSIFGDNDNLISFGGSSLSIASRDIVIDAGARVGAFTMDFTSLNTAAPAILGGGGTPQGGGTGVGYSFIAEELERLEVGAFRFVQPEVGEQSGNAPDLIVRDVLAAGSLDDGVSSIEVVVDGPNGIARVEGVAAVVDAAPTDSFSLFAPGRIEVVTPGGLGIVGLDGDPTGTLFLGSDQIWVADSDLIALLQADSTFAGRNDQLAVAASGSNDPLGYLRAGAVSIEVGSQLLVRNSGTTSAQGGILVGEGGLSIFGGSNTESGLDVFAYGARLDSDGSLVTGEEFYQEVNFNNDGSSTGSSFYTDASEFNDCLINTGECDAVVTPEPPPEPEPPTNEESPDPAVVSVNNPAVVEAAISTTQPVETTEQESNDDFGIDFPGLVEAEDVEEEGDVEDPVASGGDSSLYGQGNSGNVRVEGN